jgi:AMMECR1 domain-containing protein|tara:strand:- start:338 stop:526 length:189 start_codon:yes stop_codon:yes gene_type:complete
VIQSTIKAANEDARFPALEMQDFKELTISEDVLTPPEIIKDLFNTISTSENRTLYGWTIESV